MMLFLNVIILGVVSLKLANGAAVCDEEKFDEVAGTLLFYSAKELRPVDEIGWKRACENDTKTFNWIENYAKMCIKGVAGGIMRLLMDSSGEEIHSRCYGEMHVEYLKHVPCLNTVSDELATCNRNMTALLEATNKLEKRQQLLANSCCSIQFYSQCMESRARTKCSQETADFVKGIVYRIGENLLEGPCGKFTLDSKECVELRNADISHEVKYKSFVPAMINVLNHYG